MRNKCVICEGDKLETIFSSQEMPVFMGTVKTSQEFYYLPMIYDECLSCGNVQLKNHPDLDKVYLNNHNIDLVGQLWNSHYDEFKEFIGDITGRNILEISDPSAKLAKRCENFHKWTIIEMSPHFESTEKINVIRNFFSSNINLEELSVDVIVHSHFFEHSLNPNSDLKKMWDILPNGGDMFFSVPNLKSLIKDSNSPTALSFEHTYFYDAEFLSNLLMKNGFEIRNIQYYKKHSIFFHVRKSDIKDITFNYNSQRQFFFDCFNFHKSNIKKINEKLQNEENVFIYGSHVTSQYYLFNGLNLKIKGVLDNSVSKNGNFLYGTDLITYFPEEILKCEECSVIVSHSSVYKNEIIENISRLAKEKSINFL